LKATLLSVCLFVLAITGCKPFHYSEKDIEGTFTRSNDDSSFLKYDLNFYNGNFSLVDARDYSKVHGGRWYNCCDTLTYGQWKIDNTHGVLIMSTPTLSDGYVRSTVTEEISGSPDSVYFIISNPIEKRMGKVHSDVTYMLSFASSPEELEVSYDEVEYNSNRIVMPNPHHDRIIFFAIYIYPAHNLRVNNIAVNSANIGVEYTVKTRGANVFKIDIPKLTYGFFTYLRLKDHLVKIVNKNEIIWDGVRYLRKHTN
jgi:hypothetical protein